MPSRREGARLAALAALALFAGSARAQVIERVLAVVDDTPVLQTEAELLGRVRGLPADAALQAMVDEILMQREAARLPEASVSPEEAEEAVAALQRTLRPGALAEVSEPALRALARRQTAILKYIELRFRPRVRVEEEDVFRAYEDEQAGRASAQSFEALAPEIRERLQRRALDERIESWIGELRAAARIRLNPAFPAPARP
jgi:hypothetical protein